MTWFSDRRQDFIGEMLEIYGFINRAHLIRKSGISVPQASKDLSSHAAAHPQSVHYDNRRKAYVRRGK